MSVGDHVAVWAALAAAIYCSFMFLGNVTLSEVVKHFRAVYVQWFVRIFNIRTRPNGAISIGKKRVATLSVLCALFFGLLLILSDVLSLGDLNISFFLDASARTGISLSQRASIVLTMVLIPLAFAILTNIVFDYVSIMQSYWIARKFLRASAARVVGLILIDALFSLLLAALAVEAAFSLNYKLRELIFALTPDAYFISSYECFYCRYWLLVSGSIKGVSIPEALNQDLRNYVFLGPVFLTTIATTLWLFIYSIFTITLGVFRKFESACVYFDSLAKSQNGMSVVGGMCAVLFTLVYWGAYLAF